jgi:hypothetical protein
MSQNKSRQRHRSVAWTLNNYTAAELQHIIAGADAGSFKYIVFQQERGAAGTPHLQGYAQRAGPTELSTWKVLLSSRVHIEGAHSSPAKNREYCTKDADRIPGTLIYEKGEIPVPGERNDLSAIVAAAKDTSLSMRDIVELDGVGFLRHFKGLAAVRALYSEQRKEKTKVYWFYGSTGLGKSHLIHELAPGAFWKQNSSWWCGYEPEVHRDVAIDDYRTRFCEFEQLLKLFDRYPLTVEIKGGNLNFAAKRIFISTPKSPNDTWSLRADEDIQQLLRRIDVIVEFTSSPLRRPDGGVVANRIFHKGSVADLTVDVVAQQHDDVDERDVEPQVEFDATDAAGRRNGRPRVTVDDDRRVAIAADEPPAPSQQHYTRPTGPITDERVPSAMNRTVQGHLYNRYNPDQVRELDEGELFDDALDDEALEEYLNSLLEV